MPRRLPRWQQLVTAKWLAALLQGLCFDGVPRGTWRIFEVGSDDGVSAILKRPCQQSNLE